MRPPQKPIRMCALAFAILTTASITFTQQKNPTPEPTASDRERAELGVQRLQTYYDSPSGLYRTTGWWNSANAITTLADYSRITGDQRYNSALPNTFSAAQHTNLGFLNKFYDDEGWWALAWIDVYDLTHEDQYLQMSQSIFDDMAKGWDNTCSGGIWWSKDRKYKNAIANELFLSVAAHLADRIDDGKKKQRYLAWAKREWHWFSQTGMINSDHQINDGLDVHCRNNHKTTWSYNQGVILGGFAELYKVTRDHALLEQANELASATLKNPILVDAHGILHDPCEPDCGADGTQFKGIFIRNLASLHVVAPSADLSRFISANADSVWTGMQPPDYSIGTIWTSPWGTANASTQSSGDDVLIAAIVVGRNPEKR